MYDFANMNNAIIRGYRFVIFQYNGITPHQCGDKFIVGIITDFRCKCSESHLSIFIIDKKL